MAGRSKTERSDSANMNAGAERSGIFVDLSAQERTDESRALTLAGVARDARLDRNFLILIALASAIATLGLLQSSTAVVIGAMLVSPLMGPIMGIGFGLATIESGLIRRSLVTLAAGMGVAILVAMLIILISPIQDVTAELRARTQPNLMDLGIAVVGGIAGAIAIIRNMSGVMVGVAIATALVPPLATVGFGLVTGRTDFATGAALLFLTNTLAIAFAATIVARINRFGPSMTPQHTAMQLVGIVAVLAVLSIPLAISLDNFGREVRARAVVQSELSGLLQRRDRVESLNVSVNGDDVAVEGVVLVDKFTPLLGERLAERATQSLERKVLVDLAQVKRQSNAAEELQDQLNRRVSALEQRDAEVEAILSALTVGGLIERDALLVDAQARRVAITRDRAEEGEQVAAAKERIIAEAQSRYPGWLMQSTRPDDDSARPPAVAPEQPE
ncbi:DUF389 domain-containing protein [Sphingorhabdus sp.]|jgi:uncharacterized hydrophobic protein (TIGR00271 family)|uniref:DUF389 domain-containing protein n=1 Tax=Sphingorhabdus sp. TaxID=1902408 RepID=UPI0035AEC5A9